MKDKKLNSPELYVEGIEGLEPKIINGINKKSSAPAEAIDKELVERLVKLEALVKEEKNNLHLKAKEETARFEAKVIEELILLESKVKEEMQNLDIKTKEQVNRLEDKVKEELDHMEDKTRELTDRNEVANQELEPVLHRHESSFLNLRKSILVGLPVVLLMVVLGLMSGLKEPISSSTLEPMALEGQEQPAIPLPKTAEVAITPATETASLIMPDNLTVTDLVYDGDLLTAYVNLGAVPQSQHTARIMGLEVISELKKKYPNQNFKIIFRTGRIRPVDYAEINFAAKGNKINFSF